MNYRARTLSPQESRVVLGLAEQKQREVSRPEIIELLGVKAKAADKVIDSLRRKGWLERASWGSISSYRLKRDRMRLAKRIF
jgi:DNA-binding MarR family transcriptional regulator